MRIRGLLVAALIFFVLGGILYWSDHRKPTEDSAKPSTEAPTILKLDESVITKLGVKKRDAEPLVLTRNPSGIWQITEPKPYAADQNAVAGVLSAVATLGSQRLVDDKAADLKVYGLDQPVLQIDLTEKDKKTQQLLVGDDTPTGGAVYAKLSADPRVFTISSYTKTSIDKGLNDFRDKRLLTVNSDKISRLELLRKNQDIEFGRSKDDWQIVKPNPLRADSYQVGELVRRLTDAKMDLNTSSDDSKKTASAFAQGTLVATAKITDQSATQSLEVRKNKDTYYARSTAVDGAYKIDSDLGQSLDKGLDDFRNKNLLDFNYGEPNKIEVRSGQKTYSLMRGGQDWWWNGKKMDPSNVQSLISKLRDLKSTGFPDAGFTNADFEATVTSQDGRRIEKILVAKSGNEYLAKRENEPTFYRLDSAAFEELQKAAEGVEGTSASAK